MERSNFCMYIEWGDSIPLSPGIRGYLRGSNLLASFHFVNQDPEVRKNAIFIPAQIKLTSKYYVSCISALLFSGKCCRDTKHPLTRATIYCWSFICGVSDSLGMFCPEARFFSLFPCMWLSKVKFWWYNNISQVIMYYLPLIYVVYFSWNQGNSGDPLGSLIVCTSRLQYKNSQVPSSLLQAAMLFIFTALFDNLFLPTFIICLPLWIC